MRIRANELHNRIVHAVGERQGVHVIDTAAGVDGRYEDGYIDIAHMTQLGRERFTANLLAGLEASIGAASSAGCVRRP